MTDYGSGVLGAPGGRTLRIQGTDGDGLQVWAIGDSILRNDGDALATMLRDRFAIELGWDAQASRATTACVDVLEQQVFMHGAPDVLVMASGTNDIFDPPQVAGQIERALAVVGPACRVIWVNVWVRRWKSTDPVEQRYADQQNSGWVTAQIAAAAGRHEQLSVARWFEYLSSPNSSGALVRPLQCLTDGCHTSVAGRVARNTLIANAVGEALAEEVV